MGAITHMLTEKSRGQAPAILFDDVPGYPHGLSHALRPAVLDQAHRAHARAAARLRPQGRHRAALSRSACRNSSRCRRASSMTGRFSRTCIEGDAIDVLKFPVPRHHEHDKARFIGTADCVMTKDPDIGWYNLGAYRSQVYDGKTVGCQITEGKHGRIHRDKYFARGEPMKVVILCGQDPLLFMLSSSPLPEVERDGHRRRAARRADRRGARALIPAFRSRPIARSPSKARQCRARCGRKARSASGWAITPTTRRIGPMSTSKPSCTATIRS